MRKNPTAASTNYRPLCLYRGDFAVRLATLLFSLVLLAACAGNRTEIAEALPLEPEPPRWRAIALSDSRVVANEPRPAPEIAMLAREASLQAVEELGNGIISAEEVWTTVIDMRDPHDPRIGSYQGTQPVYPASVIKLVYMLTAYDQNRTRGLPLDEDTRSDIYDMIVYSDNGATIRTLERLSNTAGGPELREAARVSFGLKRQIPTEYMKQLGLEGLWATNGTFDGNNPVTPRDFQWLGDRAGDNYEKSNMMTTDDTARLLYLIYRHAVVDFEACEEMIELMRRGDDKPGSYFSKILPEGARLYGKTGSTDICRHEASIIELPDGGTVIVACFSKIRKTGDEPNPQVIERTTELVIENMMTTPGEWDNTTADHAPGTMPPPE